MNKLENEWKILHSDIERYERHSLYIKLTAVLVSLITIVMNVNVIFSVLLILVLWLQDGIWKTFQSRLLVRIIILEAQIKESTDPTDGFQLYSQWEAQRQGVAGLIKEYVRNSLKPTVSYPYVVLIFLAIGIWFFL